MKKIQLFIFTMLSIITFSNSNISGPKVYLGAGIGMGTRFLHHNDSYEKLDYYGYYDYYSYYYSTSLGLDLDVNLGPIWSYKINEKRSVDFGPKFSVTLRNHANMHRYYYSNPSYIGSLVFKFNMGFDYNLLLSDKKTKIYFGSNLGFGPYFLWYEKKIISYKTVTFHPKPLMIIDYDVHAGIKLNNDTLRIGGSLGTRGLIFEIGKIFSN